MHLPSTSFCTAAQTHICTSYLMTHLTSSLWTKRGFYLSIRDGPPGQSPKPARSMGNKIRATIYSPIELGYGCRKAYKTDTEPNAFWNGKCGGRVCGKKRARYSTPVPFLAQLRCRVSFNKVVHLVDDGQARAWVEVRTRARSIPERREATRKDIIAHINYKNYTIWRDPDQKIQADKVTWLHPDIVNQDPGTRGHHVSSQAVLLGREKR